MTVYCPKYLVAYALRGRYQPREHYNKCHKVTVDIVFACPKSYKISAEYGKHTVNHTEHHKDNSADTHHFVLYRFTVGSALYHTDGSRHKHRIKLTAYGLIILNYL